MLVHQTVTCPYCGAPFDTRLDLSAGPQRYIEDCCVCCQPIEFQLRVDVAGELAGVDLKRGDD